MKTREEIDAEYDRFAKIHASRDMDPGEEGVFEALGWVLGYTGKPSELYGLDDEE